MIKRIFIPFSTAVFLLTLLITLAQQTTASPTNPILINAVYYDGYESGEPDEAVQIINVSNSSVDITGWKLTDNSSTTIISATTSIAAKETFWLAKNRESFFKQFGYFPDFFVQSSEQVPNLDGTWPGFANSGDEVVLKDDSDILQDVVVYEGGDVAQTGWLGTAVNPYTVSSVFAAEGQILTRIRDQITGLPIPDTDTANDWAQGSADVINGRKVHYPGWNVDTFFSTTQITETATLTIAIAPDNAYETILGQINSAQTSIQIESHTFENLAIMEALQTAQTRGVNVTIFMEGGPPGGIDDQENYICRQLKTEHDACWFMISDSSNKINDRYKFMHAKFILIDGERVLISSENLSPNSLPSDDKSDGTWGRRGVVLVTDAPSVVAHVQAIFNDDFDFDHQDILSATAVLDPLDPGFIPNPETGGITYTVRYPTPTTVQGEFAFELVQSPENSLRDEDGLLGLLNQAGNGDSVWVQQLTERPYWGATSSNATDDPNPRLEAYIDAARRGADVRLMLDSFFDNPNSATSNTATCNYVNTIATNEELTLNCKLANPAGLGIHNKMIIVNINDEGFIHVGSINGSELSNKGNRELAIQIQSNEVYHLLAEMFRADWGYEVYLPTVLNNYIGPAQHILISEVLYDPFGQDDAEFIELVNPTNRVVDITDYGIGDAVNTTDFEDMRRFPSGTTIAPNSTLVIATSATAFRAEHSQNPDFEILSTDPTVPDLIDDPSWGDPNALLQLANGGDEVILRDAANQVVDVITYGTGSYPGITPCPPVSTSNHSLERFPYNIDTDDCAADFRDWPFPNPGTLP